MKVFSLKDMYKGWFIGNFEPAAFKTENFEVGTIVHPKGSFWDTHYHKLATEITYLVKGKMKICDTIVSEGEIFVIDPYEVASPEFLEDCTVVVIKTPSVPGDKYVISDENKPA